MYEKGILLIGALVLLGGGAALLSSCTDAPSNSHSSSSEAADEKRPSDSGIPQNASTPKRSDEAVPQEIAWLTDYDNALQQAKKEGTLVVIDFFATWCGPCQMMERTTFVDERVRRRMMKFVPLKIDVDRQREIAAKYGIQSLPTTAVVGSDGNVITGAMGYLDADRLLEVLSRAKSKGQAQPERGVLGKKAPSFGVRTWFNLPKGKDSVDIGDYEGKVVYLYGFQSWCPGCRKYGFPTLTKLIEHYESNKEVAFIAVQTTFEGFSTNTPQSAKETAERYDLAIPVGHSGSSDERSTVMQRYRTGGTPWTVIIDRKGTVRFNDFHIAPDDAVALIDRLLERTDIWR
ncbi:hypothetical protein LCGC14_1482750 [marine sediment metagenome]|uniref:Thioredoxin domain-containing protein n=1 Tax=marine sediment metagenome TaxID=412755 RepID=A0A0F9LPI3_9ZZZZ